MCVCVYMYIYIYSPHFLKTLNLVKKKKKFPSGSFWNIYWNNMEDSKFRPHTAGCV